VTVTVRCTDVRLRYGSCVPDFGTDDVTACEVTHETR